MDINSILSDLKYLEGELIILATAIVSLIYCLFFGEKASHSKLIILSGMAAALYTIFNTKYDSTLLLNESLVSNSIIGAFRFLILLSSTISMLFILRYKTQFEVPILIAITTFSLMLLVASNDLITMYLTMELSAISLYVIIASNKNSYISTEAALKYFILGSVASCIFLFGASTISGFAGSFSFDEIGSYIFTIEDENILPILLTFSSFLVLVAFFFKMSLAPFHAWLADIYHGAPPYGSLIIGSGSKIAIFGLFVRAIYTLFDNLNLELQTLIIVVSILSIFIGSIAAIMQEDLRRILAYSSIANMGFAMASIATGSANGIASGFVYVVLYSLLMFIPAFVLISLLAQAKHRDDPTIVLSDLRELSISNPYKTAALTIIMLSTGGLPPFAGFFGKFFILINIIAQEMMALSIIFIVGAILSSIYSIIVIKSIYFSTIDLKSIMPTFTLQCKFEMTLVFLISIANILYCIYASDSVTFFSNLFRALL
jgi:NADH-quinone oxidoreductase subunit N